MKATMGRADSNGNGVSIPCGIRKPEENLARQRERLAGIELGVEVPGKQGNTASLKNETSKGASLASKSWPTSLTEMVRWTAPKKR
jgi:hypothetical protein